MCEPRASVACFARSTNEKSAVPKSAKIAEDPEDHPEVADPVRDERLLAGRGREVLVVVVADEEVRAQAHAFPAHEEQRQVVRQDEHEHREHEEVQVREVAAVPLLVLHVADAVDVDERPDERDERQHERRQRVEAERDVDRVVARGHPRVDVLDDGRDPLGATQGLEDVRDERREGRGRRRDRPSRRRRRRGRAAGRRAGAPADGRAPRSASARALAKTSATSPFRRKPGERKDRDEPELVHARLTTSGARSCPRPPCGGRGRARRRSRGRRPPRRRRRRSRRRRSSAPRGRRASART